MNPIEISRLESAMENYLQAVSQLQLKVQRTIANGDIDKAATHCMALTTVSQQLQDTLLALQAAYIVEEQSANDPTITQVQEE